MLGRQQEPKEQFDGVLDNIESAVETNIVKFSQSPDGVEHTVITDKPASEDEESRGASILRIALWSIVVVMLLVLTVMMMMIYG